MRRASGSDGSSVLYFAEERAVSKCRAWPKRHGRTRGILGLRRPLENGRRTVVWVHTGTRQPRVGQAWLSKEPSRTKQMPMLGTTSRFILCGLVRRVSCDNPLLGCIGACIATNLLDYLHKSMCEGQLLRPGEAIPNREFIRSKVRFSLIQPYFLAQLSHHAPSPPTQPSTSIYSLYTPHPQAGQAAL